MKRIIILASIFLTPIMASATGMYQCEAVAAENWLGEKNITQILTDKGWQVRKMKKDGGCWEVYGTMPEGQRVEAYLHPETGEIQLINQRGKVLFDIRNQQ